MRKNTSNYQFSFSALPMLGRKTFCAWDVPWHTDTDTISSLLYP